MVCPRDFQGLIIIIYVIPSSVVSTMGLLIDAPMNQCPLKREDLLVQIINFIHYVLCVLLYVLPTDVTDVQDVR
jgi:hypothetical protein